MGGLTARARSARRPLSRRAWWLVAAAPVVLLACADDDESSADPTNEPVPASTVEEDALVPVGTTEGETRPVPTVPPSTIEGTVGSEPGVVDASPTIAPVPVDPDAPTTTVAPPTTELLSDPQPVPGSTSPAPAPPSTVEGDPDACERLAAFDIVGVITEAGGPATTGDAVGVEVCRYSAGPFVAEVHYLSVAEVRDDWFTRTGIEPVGEVSADAVGFSSYLAPGATAGEGYTIALEGGSRGVVVAVGGTGDARYVAGQVAIFARESG